MNIYKDRQPVCIDEFYTNEYQEIVSNDVKNLTIDMVNLRLNANIKRTPEQLEKCKKWLLEFYTANEMSLQELDDLCYEDSNWVFNQIFI